MNLFGWSIGRKAATIDQIIQRLEAAYESHSGVAVTPDNCMQSPTVHAIVTAVSRRLSTAPVHVLRRSTSGGRTRREEQPDHPVARLLRRPNDWQTSSSYWLDATSSLVRTGNFYALKVRGQTGPIRQLLPLFCNVEVEQGRDWSLTYKVTQHGQYHEFAPFEVHHARGPARNGVKGDSPVIDCREAIGLEIAAERFGGSLFANGAAPLMVFQYAAASQGHKTAQDRRQFVEDFQEQYNKRRRFRALFLPKGIEQGTPIDIQNDKAQFLETRKLQRSIIGGAFGVPNHLLNDLERGTYNNVEQQSIEFVQNCVLPYARMFESAMERDLLTEDDRRAGMQIRFNLDGALRGDFKSRQEGMQIQRQNGVINANEWREADGRNPLSDEDGGDEYWRQGPSGQSASTNGARSLNGSGGGAERESDNAAA